MFPGQKKVPFEMDSRRDQPKRHHFIEIVWGITFIQPAGLEIWFVALYIDFYRPPILMFWTF